MAKSNTKKQGVSQIFIFVAVILVAVFVLVGINKKPAPNDTNIQSDAQQLAKTDCNLSGDPIINIDQKIVNDADLINEDVYWANDNYDQNIKVWKQANNAYCAEINLVGSYDAQQGATSPGNKQAVLTGNEDGSLNGSSRVTIVGDLKSNPEWPTTGSVGTEDFECDLQDTCTDYESKLWYTKYFENIEEGYPNVEWYKWIYNNGDKVWINSSEGNSGEDII